MNPIEPSGSNLPDNLPLLTRVADEGAPDDLPTLTEVVADNPPGTVSCAPDEERIQQLLPLLEAHLEKALTHKLGKNLEQLQRQAIGQAVSELKAELPELLRSALNRHPGL